jgi:hypothetical protein
MLNIMLLMGFLGVSWILATVVYVKSAAKAPIAPAWMDGQFETEVIFLTPVNQDIRRAA